MYEFFNTHPQVKFELANMLGALAPYKECAGWKALAFKMNELESRKTSPKPLFTDDDIGRIAWMPPTTAAESMLQRCSLAAISLGELMWALCYSDNLPAADYLQTKLPQSTESQPTS